MTIRIGRVELSTPQSVPFSVRGSEQAGVVGPFDEKGFELVGKEHGALAQGLMDGLEVEGLRYESVYVEGEDGEVPKGHYRLSGVQYEKPRGAPRLRRWRVGLTRKEKPVVFRQAEDDFLRGSVVVDSEADEGEYVSYTPSATENVVLASSDLVLALRLDETTGTDGNNVVLNPGFETYTISPGVPDNWADAGSGVYTREQTIKRTGLNSVKIRATGGGQTGLEQTLSGLVAGKSYRVEVFARTDGGGGESARLEVFNSTDSLTVAAVNGTSGAVTFERLSFDFTVVAGKTYRLFLIHASAAAGRVIYFDDVLVRELIVTNGGFETYTTSPGVPDGWILKSGLASDFTKETTLQRSGANAVKMTVSAATPPGLKQEITVAAGKSYYAEGWTRTGGGTAAPRFRIFNVTDGIQVINRAGTTGGLTYEKLSGTFTAIAGKTYELRVEDNSATNGDITYFDDCLVQEIQAKDQSGLGNHGTLKGGTNTAGPTINATGKIATAYSMDGTDDNVEIPNESSFEFDNMTVEAWVNPSTFTLANGHERVIMSKEQGSVGNTDWTFVFTTGGAARLIVKDKADVAYVVTSSVASSIGVLTHVVATRAGSVLSIYVNGVLRGQITNAPAIHNNSTRNVVVGSADSNVSGWFQGVIDEARIYRRALSAREVLNRYNATVGGTRPSNDAKPVQEGLNLPPGNWKILARVYPETTTTARLRWRLIDLNGDVITTGNQVTATTANAWQEVDLGTLTVPEGNKTANNYHVLIDDPTNTNPIRLDRVRFVPA